MTLSDEDSPAVEQTASPQTRPSRRRRNALLCIAGLVVGLSAVVYTLCADDAPTSPGKYAFTWPDVRSEDNGLPLLSWWDWESDEVQEDIESSQIDLLERRILGENRERLVVLASEAAATTETPTDDRFLDVGSIAAFLVANADRGAHFDMALKRPRIVQVAHDSYVDRSWFRLVQLRAYALYDAGEPEKAIAAALDLHLLGDRILRAGSDVIMDGTVAHLLALSTLRILVESSPPDEATLRDLIGRLRDPLWDAEITLSLSRGTYYLVDEILNAIKNETMDGPFAEVGSSQEDASWLEKSSVRALMLKPHRTRRLLIEELRRFDRIHALQFSESPVVAEVDDSMSWASILVSRNNIGRAFVASALQGHRSYHRLCCRLDFDRLGTRIYLAAHLYRQQMGTFPETLSLLVPDFVSELGRDPFDGGPIRFESRNGAIYSVGANLDDDHANSTLDLVIYLDPRDRFPE